MKRTLIGVLEGTEGTKVNIRGWVHTIRNQKNLVFLVIRDHTGLVQATYRKDDGKTQTLLEALTRESAVEIVGQVVHNDKVKLRNIEVLIESIQIHSLADPQLPIEEGSSLDARLDWRFLDLRRPSNLLIFLVQTTIEEAMREFWAQEGFVEIHSPKFMGGASESGSELFKVEYFGGTAYLAQSPQFYKQMAMAAGFDRVFEVGPVFRANPSFTSRHDTEYTSVDVEISWIDSHLDVMDFEESWLQFVFQKVQEKHGQQILETFGVEVLVPRLPFPRVPMEEAYQIIGSMGHTIDRGEKGDLDPEGERLLCSYISEQMGHQFVFVTDYPTIVRPFYHMRYDDRPNLTKSFDLLYKGLEITTGAQREHRYDRLLEQVSEKGLTTEPLQYYLDFFRFGCPPHGGFGFGLSRLLMMLLGFKNVREVTYLYRGPNRLSP